MALRIALLIKTLGAEPAVIEGSNFKAHRIMLERQYLELKQAVGPEAAREARIAARSKIRSQGLLLATSGLIPTLSPTPRKLAAEKTAMTQKAANEDSACDTEPRRSRWRIAKEKLKAFFAQPNQTVLKCPKCRMRCGLPKKAWPAKEIAEDAKRRSGGGSDLMPYECSYLPGYWHLGHSARSKKRTPRVI